MADYAKKQIVKLTLMFFLLANTLTPVTFANEQEIDCSNFSLDNLPEYDVEAAKFCFHAIYTQKHAQSNKELEQTENLTEVTSTNPIAAPGRPTQATILSQESIDEINKKTFNVPESSDSPSNENISVNVLATTEPSPDPVVIEGDPTPEFLAAERELRELNAQILPEFPVFANIDYSDNSFFYDTVGDLGRYVVWLSPAKPVYLLFKGQEKIESYVLNASAATWKVEQANRGNRDPALIVSTKAGNNTGALIVETSYATYYIHLVSSADQSMNLVKFIKKSSKEEIGQENNPPPQSLQTAGKTTVSNHQPSSNYGEIISKAGVLATINAKYKIINPCDTLEVDCDTVRRNQIQLLAPTLVYSSTKQMFLQWDKPQTSRAALFRYNPAEPGEYIPVNTSIKNDHVVIIDGVYDHLKLILDEDNFIIINAKV